MRDKHLSEEEIQEWALRKINADVYMQEHIANCASCKAKMETYQLVFSGLQHMEKPHFEFDVASLVVSQLARQKRTSFSFINYFLIFLGIAAMAVPMYFFRSYILQMFTGLSTMLLLLVGITALLIVVFQGIDMYKKYQRQMEELNFY